jgi:hypothetical protein
MTRTIKTVLVSVPSVKGYSRSVYRVVECGVDQRGHRTEKGVKVLWESRPLYRPLAGPCSHGYAAKQRAEYVRCTALAQQLDVSADQCLSK